MKFSRAHRAVLLLLLLVGMLGVTTVAWGQYASRTGNVIGTVGGACDSSTNTYGWPDTNGDILKCVSNVWTLVTQPATAAGSTGYLQFNSSGVLGASSTLFWDNANFRLGIGSSAPVVSLDLSQKTDALALPVGTQGQEPASPMNGMIRYSTTANDVEAYIGGAWTTLTTGGATASITLGSSAATPNPASSYSATTGLFSGASGQVSVTSTGNEIARFTGTGVSIGTTYVSTAAPSNGLIVQGNVGIGTSSPTATFSVTGNGYLTGGLGVGVSDTTAGTLQTSGNATVGGILSVPNVINNQISFGNASSLTYNGSNTYFGAAGGLFVSSGINGPVVAFFNTNRSYIGAGGGNVGIGTSAPDAQLSLDGQSARTIDMVREMTASTAGNNLTLQAGGATPLGTDKAGGSLVLSSGISTGTGSSGINFNIYKAAGSSGSADNATTTAMTVTGAGNVGIGTTTPGATLDIYGGSVRVMDPDTAANGFIVTNSGTTALTLTEYSGAGIVQSGGTNSLRLAGGNGTNGITFEGPLSTELAAINTQGGGAGSMIVGGTYTGYAAFRALGSNTGLPVALLAAPAGQTANILEWTSSGANGAVGTILGEISSTGNVGIGTNAPAYLLHVGSPSAVGVVADFQNSSGYCTFSPSANGILTTCTSDVRLKKDIVDAGNALAWLGTMRIRDFTLRATGERRTAQEMMKVHPEMVRMGATGFYQVDVPDAWKLIKAIQELKADNENLAASLKAANDNVADLRASFEAYKDAHP